MNFKFTELSKCVFDAFTAYEKTKDLITRKQNLVEQVFSVHQTAPETILFLGFDAWVLGDWKNTAIYVSMITDEVAASLDKMGVIYTRISTAELEVYDYQFDAVIAGDEFFTYCEDEQGQRELIELVANLTYGTLITTVKDYKNTTVKDREFSIPTVIRNNSGYSVFLEFNNHDYKVKNHWTSYVYEHGTRDIIHGPFSRRPVFFKQLAKFCYDASATKFMVHNDIMYKSLFKKNFEHVISVHFN